MVQAKVLKLTGGKVTIRPHMIEGGGSSEAWYGAKNLRCRESDTFSRLWNFMARWYNWRATAQTLRTDVSRAKESMSTGGKITLRRELIERGGSHEVWYGGEGGNSKSRKRHLFTVMELRDSSVQLARHCPNTENRCFSRQVWRRGWDSNPRSP